VPDDPPVEVSVPDGARPDEPASALDAPATLTPRELALAPPTLDAPPALTPPKLSLAPPTLDAPEPLSFLEACCELQLAAKIETNMQKV